MRQRKSDEGEEVKEYEINMEQREKAEEKMEENDDRRGEEEQKR